MTSISKGVYILIIVVRRDVTVNVGVLGEVCFEKGFYAYVGSAQKDLKKRVERHVKKTKRKFWHIDYLLGNDAVKVQAIFCREVGRAEDCQVAQALGENGFPVKKVRVLRLSMLKSLVQSGGVSVFKRNHA